MSHDVEKQGKGLNCGSCAGLSRERVFDAKCIELGRIPTSKACTRHVPDAFSLMQDQESRVTSLIDMGKVFRRMSPNDLQILAALMMNERKTRKAGFSLMEKVYIRVTGQSGRNYMGNFAMGYVLDATKETIRVISENGTTAIVLPNEKNSSNLYTVQRFAPIRAEIAKDRKWVDPEVVKDRARMQASMATLDQADQAGLLETPTAARRKIKKVKEKDDLVSFVAKMSRGVIRTRKDEGNLDETFSVSW